jgi:hypothetical protein
MIDFLKKLSPLSQVLILTSLCSASHHLFADEPQENAVVKPLMQNASR